MQTGTRYNSYHTLSAIEFELANGHRYNSSVAADRQRFEQEEEWLCQGLLRIREQILKNDEIRNRIIERYKIKNVTGYSMNAFVDFEHPMDIFAHLAHRWGGYFGIYRFGGVEHLAADACV